MVGRDVAREANQEWAIEDEFIENLEEKALVVSGTGFMR